MNVEQPHEGCGCFKNEKLMANGAGYLSVEEAMVYLGIDCTRRSFMVTYVHGKNPKIPSMLIGRKRFFDTKDLNDYMKQVKTKTL